MFIKYLTNCEILQYCRDNAVCIVTMLRAGRPGYNFRQRQWWDSFFILSNASRPILWTTQPPIKWVPGVLSLEIKRAEHEADHSPPSSAECKNAWSSQKSSWRGV